MVRPLRVADRLADRHKELMVECILLCGRLLIRARWGCGVSEGCRQVCPHGTPVRNPLIYVRRATLGKEVTLG